jgi:hypothetical protein
MTTILIVSGLVPHFAQAPVSYISLDTLPDAYLAFDVEVSFKPENPDGLILFNGQNEFGIGDFVSLILKDGVPEFRFVRFFFSYSETCVQRPLLGLQSGCCSKVINVIKLCLGYL